jgi:hypothetical protein
MLHEFSDTQEAYAASQCYVDTGDVLYVPSENVVGVSYTWPIAITAERGDLHEIVRIQDADPDLQQLVMDAAWEFVRAAQHM